MWRSVRVDEAAEIVGGGTPSRRNATFWGGGVPWATPTDITSSSGAFLTDTKESITAAGIRGSSARVLPIGTVLLTSRATIGEARIAAIELCTNQGFKNLIARKGFDPGFLYYQVCRNRRQFERYAVGSTFPEINKRDTARVEFEWPSDSTEQLQIASVLRTVDTQIEQTQILVAKLEQVRLGLLHDLFTRGIDEKGRLRPPREEAAHLYQHTELGWLPKDWRVCQLGGFIGRIDSGWSPNCDAAASSDGQWGVLKTTAVVWPGYDSTENKRLPAGVAARRELEVSEGDILITRKGPMERVGVAVFVDKTRRNLMFPDTVFRTRLTPDLGMCGPFLVAAIESEAIQKHWWKRKVGLADAQVNLNHGIVRFTPLMCPIPNEQEQILLRKSAIDNDLRSEGSLLKILLDLRMGLLDDLLTGRTQVQRTLSASGRAA